MTAKVFLSANEVAHDSFLLAHKIFTSGYRPDAIIALWRGGSPIGIVVHEFMAFKGVDCYHSIVKCTSYTGIGTSGAPVVESIDHVRKRLTSNSKVLVVDDIFDTGRTAACMLEELHKTTPHVRFAVPYYKPSKNTTVIEPDYYVRATDSWLVFPHELSGLSAEEIRRKDPFVHSLLY